MSSRIYHTEEERRAAVRRRDRERYRRNRDRKLDYQKQYYEKHRERIIAKVTAYKYTPSGQESHQRYKHSEKAKLTTKTYKESLSGKANQLFLAARQRAKGKGLPFTITRQMVTDRLVAINGIAEVIADQLDFSTRDDVRRNPYGPSIDQKIPGNGYTPENFQIVTNWYNIFKQDLTDEEALDILRRAVIPKAAA